MRCPTQVSRFRKTDGSPHEGGGGVGTRPVDPRVFEDFPGRNEGYGQKDSRLTVRRQGRCPGTPPVPTDNGTNTTDPVGASLPTSDPTPSFLGSRSLTE